MAFTFDTDVTLNSGKILQTNTVKLPTESGGSTYGLGSSGQVLMSNGSGVYWSGAATQDSAGLMSAADKTKLDGIAAGAQVNPTKTSQLKNDSGFLTSHQDISGKANTSDAIKSITRSGTTFTATRANGTTFTFTQQDTNTWPTALSQLANDVGYITASGNTWRPVTSDINNTDGSTACSATLSNWIYVVLANALNGKVDTSYFKTTYLGAVSPSANGNINLGISSSNYVLSVRCISTDDVIAEPFLSSTHTRWWANLRGAGSPWSVKTSGTYNFEVLYV